MKISVDTSPCTIVGSECECKAGSGHCSHSVGLIYLKSHYQKLGLKGSYLALEFNIINKFKINWNSSSATMLGEFLWRNRIEFYVQCFTAVPPVHSKTSLPQTWHIPSRVEGLTPKCVDRLEINKVKLEQGPPKRKSALHKEFCPMFTAKLRSLSHQNFHNYWYRTWNLLKVMLR